MLNNKAFTLLFLLVILFIPTYTLAQSMPGINLTDTNQIGKNFVFIGGANSDIKGNVYFTDILARKIYKIDSHNQITTFLDNNQDCDNLVFDPKDNLIACQRTKGTNKRIVTIDINTKELTSIVETFENKPFDGLNGAVIDQQGGIYFTDSANSTVFGGSRFQDVDSIYYYSSTGIVTRVIVAGGILRQDGPNTIVLSPDEKTLYVCFSNELGLMAYPILRPGQVGMGHKIMDLGVRNNNLNNNLINTRLTVDVKGNLYLARVTDSWNISVISPKGEILQDISVPGELVANCAFGGADFKTLYVFSRTAVYAIRLPVAGYHIGFPDFDLDIIPDSQMVNAGKSTSFSIKAKSVSPFSPFTQPINLSANIVPANEFIRLNIDSSIITTNDTTNLTVNTFEDALGTFSLVLKATVGEITKTFTKTIIVLEPLKPDFDIALDSDNLTLNRGQSSQIKLNIVRKDGFAENVTINAPDTAFLKNLKLVITPSLQSTTDEKVSFSIKAKKKAKLGSQILIFTAKDSSGRTKTTLLNLIIQ